MLVPAVTRRQPLTIGPISRRVSLRPLLGVSRSLARIVAGSRKEVVSSASSAGRVVWVRLA